MFPGIVWGLVLLLFYLVVDKAVQYMYVHNGCLHFIK